MAKKKELVEHPDHYGGAENPYEAVKIIDALDLNFNLGNVVKYIVRLDKKDDSLMDLKKAIFYLNREVARRESKTKKGKK